MTPKHFAAIATILRAAAGMAEDAGSEEALECVDFVARSICDCCIDRSKGLRFLEKCGYGI